MELPYFTSSALLQVLILSGGALLMISFLRTARGTGMLRGLAVTLAVGGLGLFGIAWFLELEELKHVLQAILEVAVIVLAILFHPELRRGIMSLGDNRLLGRFLRPDRRDVIQEVADAIISMAKRREGALIAFEMRQPLDGFVERGVRIDAEVNRLLLENLFHHGTPLHDGGVIIRGDRVVAAACIFPLTENREISKSTGTRHRASIGLTEETDAVTVTVSEETGAIGVCKNGELDRRVARDTLVEVLRERLGETDATEDQGPRASWVRGLMRAILSRPGEKVAALVLGTIIFFTAWSAVRTEATFTLRLNVVAEGSGQTSFVPDMLTVVVPDNVSLRFLDKAGTDGICQLRIDAEREKINRLQGGQFGARLQIQSGETGMRTVSPSDLTWVLGNEQYNEELNVEWFASELRLNLRQLGVVSVTPTADHVVIKTENLVQGREVGLDGIDFSLSEVEVRGPAETIQSITESFAFQDVTMADRSAKDWSEDPSWSATLELSQDLLDQSFELVQEIKVEFPVRPATISVGDVEMDVTLVWLDATRDDLTHTYQPPDKRVTLEIEIVGVPLDVDEEASLLIRLRDLVRSDARAFVDVSAVSADESRGEVLVRSIDPDVWLQELPESVTENLVGAEDIELRVRLRESDRELLLVPVENDALDGEDGENP
jgi:diadenylate cyclase